MTDQNSGSPVIFGEVLYDRFPDGKNVLGGAPFNVAWHLQALGLAPLLVTRVGDDALGSDIRQAMSDWGLSTRGLQIDANRPTGTVEVSLADGEPRYDIADDRAYDHIEVGQVPALPPGGILYHGILALRHPTSRDALIRIKQACGARVFVDVNLRSPWWRQDTVMTLLEGATWVKLNQEELGQLTSVEQTMPDQAAWLVAELKLSGLVVTLGEAGAVVFVGQEMIQAEVPGSRAVVVDTVGAGDSFSSVVLLGLARGWEWPLILERAQLLAAAIVGLRGATTTDLTFYETFTRMWE